jgi:uncharacterized protein YndB with AHSA1/START domain
MTQPQAPAAPAGEVRIEGDHASLYFDRFLPHPPEAVWAALTEPAQLAQWSMNQATIEGREGGSIDFVTAPANFHWTGRILAWEPNRVFEHEMTMGPRHDLPFDMPGEQAVVRWELSPEGSGTRLRLSFRNLRRMTALGFAPGQHVLLDRLAAQLANEPLPNFMQGQETVRGLYPSWR